MAKQALKLRVFLSEDDATNTAVVRWIAEQSPAHFVVRHDADNDDARRHLHALLWAKNAQTVRVTLTRAFPFLKGNGAYAVGELPDADAVATYERYMCHAGGDGDAVAVLSAQAPVGADAGQYGPAWCARQNREFYRQQREFKKRKDDRKENDVVRLERRCREAGATTRQQVGEALVAMYARDARAMNVFHMRAVVNAVCVRLLGADERQALVAEVTRL